MGTGIVKSSFFRLEVEFEVFAGKSSGTAVMLAVAVCSGRAGWMYVRSEMES